MSEPHLEHSIFGADEAEHQVRRRRRRPPRRRGRRLLVLLLAVAIVGGAVYAAYGVLRPIVTELTASNDYPGPGAGEVRFTVNDGDSGRAIGVALEKADVVKSSKAFLDAAATDTRSAGIQPGTYSLRRQMAAKDALAILVNPKNRTVPHVTLPEGLWVSEVFAALSKGTKIPVKEYEAAAKDPASLGLPASAEGQPGGLPLPLDLRVPRQVHRPRAAEHDGEEDRGRAGQGGRRPGRHGAHDGRCLHRRGRGQRRRRPRQGRPGHREPAATPETGPTRGLLQMDSTVHYAVKKRGKAGTTDADRKSASPYNTYRVPGPAPGADQQPRGRLDRGRRTPRRRALAVLRDRQPRHR